MRSFAARLFLGFTIWLFCLSTAAAGPGLSAPIDAVVEESVFGVRLGERRVGGAPVVLEVDRHSPAWIAGLRPGDEILRVQDTNVPNLRQAVRLLNGVERGRDVRLQIRRTAIETSVSFASPGRKTVEPAPAPAAALGPNAAPGQARGGRKPPKQKAAAPEKGQPETGDTATGDEKKVKKTRKSRSGIILKPLPSDR